MTGRLTRIVFACLLGTALTATQALAAVSAACQPTANHSCCCPTQHAAPSCRMRCADAQAPDVVSASARALTVPAPHVIAAGLEDTARLEEARASSVTLAYAPLRPPTLKRYLLDCTFRL